jgi:heterodisulfide reductase subunit C1
MADLYHELYNDVRLQEGLKSCMNCGVCTAICPAAEFFDYDPRVLLGLIQTRDNKQIEELLKSDFIWYCGQCMSCKTRCPRGNCPGLVINVLRKVSQEKGYFTESKMGRQQYAIVRNTGKSLLEFGYCVHPQIVKPQLHPEQGPAWDWVYENQEEVFERLGANLNGDGAGAMRKISKENLDELKAIFDETGCTELFNSIEKYSEIKAREMGLFNADDESMDDYLDHVANE